MQRARCMLHAKDRTNIAQRKAVARQACTDGLDGFCLAAWPATKPPGEQVSLALGCLHWMSQPRMRPAFLSLKKKEKKESNSWAFTCFVGANSTQLLSQEGLDPAQFIPIRPPIFRHSPRIGQSPGQNWPWQKHLISCWPELAGVDKSKN